jgi:hypothetical protein
MAEENKSKDHLSVKKKQKEDFFIIPLIRLSMPKVLYVCRFNSPTLVLDDAAKLPWARSWTPDSNQN